MHLTGNIYEAAALMACGVPLAGIVPGRRVQFLFREGGQEDIPQLLDRHRNGTLTVNSWDYAAHLQSLKGACVDNRTRRPEATSNAAQPGVAP